MKGCGIFMEYGVAFTASCQTMLSLPLNFDLQKVLGAYMSHDGNGDDGNQQDMLSTSSLRRKLFFHGDTSSLAPSPVKWVSVCIVWDGMVDWCPA